jgi:ribosome biogenesis GTPase
MSSHDSPRPAFDAELAALGWTDVEASAFTTHAAQGLRPARVIAEHRDRYIVALGDAERDAVLGGRMRHDASAREALPAVGDWVAIAIEPGDGPAVIRALLPRRSAFARKTAGEHTAPQIVAANVDLALVASSLAGDFNERRLERYVALAWESGAMPVVVLTKSDLADDVGAAIALASAIAPGVDVVALSAATGEGIAALERHLAPGRTAVLVGSSGVGKSTLVNHLAREARMRTGDVRDDGRGRHTTTHRELVRLDSGALLIDTPGMRELQLWATDDGLAAAFAEIDALASRCRFGDCAHESEPGCAVLDALASGALDADRLESWRRLRREIAWLERKRDERARAEHGAEIRTLMRSVRAHLKRKYE